MLCFLETYLEVPRQDQTPKTDDIHITTFMRGDIPYPSPTSCFHCRSKTRQSHLLLLLLLPPSRTSPSPSHGKIITQRPPKRRRNHQPRSRSQLTTPKPQRKPCDLIDEEARILLIRRYPNIQPRAHLQRLIVVFQLESWRRRV
jgi:hypothetical protein